MLTKVAVGVRAYEGLRLRGKGRQEKKPQAGSVFAIGEDDYGQCAGRGTGQARSSQ